ncbi:MAG: hypothetical protein KGZ97_01295 [Bacteroidetes bacterium]|nr:hypothetical protein [Bacteroidota bacterium]
MLRVIKNKLNIKNNFQLLVLIFFSLFFSLFAVFYLYDLSQSFYYYIFSGTDKVVFLEHDECTDNLERLLEHEELKGKLLLILPNNLYTPPDSVWYTSLKKLFLEIDPRLFAIVFISSRSCSKGFYWERFRFFRVSEYKEYIKKNDLWGYHFTVNLDAVNNFKKLKNYEVKDYVSSRSFWLISADRSTIYFDLEKSTMSDYRLLKESILKIIDK